MQLVLSAPVHYSLELTPLCNNRCPGCFNVFIDDKMSRPMHDVRPPLSADQWRTILTQLRPHATRLKLTGGEPTLHPEFEEIVRTISELGISFSVFTNARWSKPERLVDLLKSTPQFVGFLISLHGFTPAVHEAYSGIRGSFQETVDNIRLAARAGISVATSTVITKQNYSQMADLIKFAVSLGADHAVINRYLGEPLPEIEPSEDQLRRAVQEVDQQIRVGARAKYGNCVPQCFIENLSSGCLAGVAYCAISPWGEMRPCNHSPRVVGNLLQQSVEDVWHSAQMEAWRGLMPSSCENSCAAFTTCHGACRALIEIRGDQRDPLRGDPIHLMSQPPKRVTLYEGLRPVGNYHLRQEEFGMVLLHRNQVVPVAFEDIPILGACDGKHTLREIEQQFGARGLRIIATLQQKDLIHFSAPTAGTHSSVLDAPVAV